MTLTEIVKVLDNLEPEERWRRAAELPSHLLLQWLDHVFSADQPAADVAEEMPPGGDDPSPGLARQTRLSTGAYSLVLG